MQTFTSGTINIFVWTWSMHIYINWCAEEYWKLRYANHWTKIMIQHSLTFTCPTQWFPVTTSLAPLGGRTEHSMRPLRDGINGLSVVTLQGTVYFDVWFASWPSEHWGSYPNVPPYAFQSTPSRAEKPFLVQCGAPLLQLRPVVQPKVNGGLARNRWFST